MDLQLTSILLFSILAGTFIMNADAVFEEQEAYDIQPGHLVSTRFRLSSNNPDYGIKRDVSKEDCEGAGEKVRKTATACSPVSPEVFGVKYEEKDVVYYPMYLADCGGGVYVKVIGSNQFVVYRT